MYQPDREWIFMSPIDYTYILCLYRFRFDSNSVHYETPLALLRRKSAVRMVHTECSQHYL